MCYATKRRIADCVKRLMHHKEISRITIQDIMDETQMSRQSFYYHFRDIYDVLEWIGVHDFEHQLMGEEYDSMEAWVCDMMLVLKSERAFYEKLANEIAWPKLIRSVKGDMEAQIKRMLLTGNEKMFYNHPEELNSCAEFLSTSFCYYLLDYVYQKKNLSDEKIINDVGFIMKMISGHGKPEKQTITPFPRAMVM